MNKKHIGSDFDDFLKEEKLLKKTKIVAINRLSKNAKNMKSEYNFSKGKRGAVVRAPKGKTRITIRLDDDVLDWFRNQVEESGGGNYQTLINNALREFIHQQEEPIEVILRRVVREELQSASQ